MPFPFVKVTKFIVKRRIPVKIVCREISFMISLMPYYL
ncbi:hypothetical protein NIASO_13650 [Niabella soli DSM 19437]|uniref:Uncharacterized protein n=1 Tax=Niabella soli DSM 19437 TaxID=929713 RepID=W0F8R2_9BACT|nr:hypothetical protein NIASO_13650 [Niabella soli DSM 19437]